MSKQILAIASCRVSSDEQLQNNSLNRQKQSVISAAERLGVVIRKDGWWSLSVSSKKGKNLERKDIKQMLEYCQSNKKVKYLIVDEPDRFMRSIEEAMYLEMEFKLRGVKVWYASDDSLNTEDMNSKLMRFMKYYVAEGSNDERQRKSINGQTAALNEGRYTFCPKPGYMKVLGNEPGIHEIHPIRGKALQKVLIDIADRRVTPTQGLINLNKSEFMSDGHSLYKMDKFRKIATDPYYMGTVWIDKQVQVRNDNGKHEPLITREQHIALLDIFENKKKNQIGPRKNGNPKYPLNNIVSCDLCSDRKFGRIVGVDIHNGKNRSKIYEKYRCRECKRALPRDELHKKVEDFFTEKPISNEGVRELLEALDVVWKREEMESKNQAMRIRTKIKHLTREIEDKIEAVTDPKFASVRDDILDGIERKKEEVLEFEKELTRIEASAEDDRNEFLTFAFQFIDDIGSNFLDPILVSQENRLRCKQILFPAGFCWDENKNVYTPEISELYRLVTKKKSTEVLKDSHLVRSYRTCSNFLTH